MSESVLAGTVLCEPTTSRCARMSVSQRSTRGAAENGHTVLGAEFLCMTVELPGCGLMTFEWTWATLFSVTLLVRTVLRGGAGSAAALGRGAQRRLIHHDAGFRLVRIAARASASVSFTLLAMRAEGGGAHVRQGQ